MKETYAAKDVQTIRSSNLNIEIYVHLFSGDKIFGRLKTGAAGPRSFKTYLTASSEDLSDRLA